ncbi:hypothetical protein H0H93_007087, partial [Arthromyces matolae]
ELCLECSKDPLLLTELTRWAFAAVNRAETWLCHPTVLRLYAQQFDLNVPVSGKIFPILPGFQAISGLGCAVQMKNHLGLKDVLESVWPKAWKWIDAVSRGYVFIAKSLPPRDQSEAISVALCIQHIILFLITDSPSPSVLSTEGLFRLVLEMYLSPLLEDGSPLLVESRINPSVALRILCSTPSTKFEECGQVLGWNRTKAAVALCEPIKRATGPRYKWIKCLPYLCAVHDELQSRNPYYYAWLSPKIVIPTICDALQTSITSKAATQRVRTVQTLLGILMKYSFFHRAGPEWVIYALRGGLVQSLLQAEAIETNSKTLSDCIRCLLDYLSYYRFYPAVLRYLIRQVPHAASTQPLSTTRASWTLLVNRITHLQRLKEEFNRSSASAYVPHVLTNQGPGRKNVALGVKSPSTAQRNASGSTGLIIETLVSLSDLLRACLDKILQVRRSSKISPPAMVYFDFVESLKISIRPFDANISRDIGERIPLLTPCLNLPTGSHISRQFVIPTDVSGELFGWYKGTDTQR